MKVSSKGEVWALILLLVLFLVSIWRLSSIFDASEFQKNPATIYLQDGTVIHCLDFVDIGHGYICETTNGTIRMPYTSVLYVKEERGGDESAQA